VTPDIATLWTSTLEQTFPKRNTTDSWRQAIDPLLIGSISSQQDQPFFAMRRLLSVVLGTLALLTTLAVVSLHIVLALCMPQNSSGRTTSKISAVLEAIVFVSGAWMLASFVSSTFRELSVRCAGVIFCLSLFAIAFAVTASVATMIYLSHLTIDLEDHILGTKQDDFLIGSSIVLGLSFVFQIAFAAIHFIFFRASDGGALSLHSFEGESHQSSPVFQVKALRYDQTTPYLQRTREMTSMDSRSPPPSFDSRPKIEAVTTIRVSLSSAIRPMTSKTQLVMPKEQRRPDSVGSNPYRTSSEDTFDTWDTSSVDTQNRQVVLEASSPPHCKSHFLEPIPGSPTASRESSPSNAEPFEPPRIRTRSRSYSPVPRTREQSAFTQQPSMSELHIHPLFRSDSPTPPPMATPGTVVVAAPNAGQVITHRQSLRSLNQMRSNTVPASPSPLGHRGSVDSKRPANDQISLRSLREVAEEPATTERVMTPPIPDWVMDTSSRSSLRSNSAGKNKTEEEAK
jgi:hypothetical protein